MQEGDLRPPRCPRNKSGIWGWRSEKMEVVSGYEAKVSTEAGGDAGDSVEWGRADGVPTPGVQCQQRGAGDQDQDGASLRPGQVTQQR